MEVIGNVALFTRAWIEIPNGFDEAVIITVALFTRAWIEISWGYSWETRERSPSSRGRGLKFAEKATNPKAIRRPLHEGVD